MTVKGAGTGEIAYWTGGSTPKIPTNHWIRIFPNSDGLPPAISDERFVYCHNKGVIPFISSKIYQPTTSTYGGAAALAALKTWFQNMPSWITKIYYTNIHEPEGDKYPGTSTAITATEFKTWHGQIMTMLGTLDPAIRAKIHFGPALTRQYEENTAGRTYDTWDPGPSTSLPSGITEFFGVDMYGNSWSTTDSSKATTAFVAPATFLSKVKAYKKSSTDTRPRIFPELGYIGAPFDTNGNARTQWLSGVYAELATWNSSNTNWAMPWQFEGFIWWNTQGKSGTALTGIGKTRWFQFDRHHNGTAYGSDPQGGYNVLANSPVTAMFNQLVAAQGLPDPDPDPGPDPDPDPTPDPDPDPTATFVATAQPGNVPPRVLLELTYASQASATVTRLDPDGRIRTVRLADPATLASGVWVGYDYESWLQGAATYTATTSVGYVTSNPVSMDVDTVWLRHPGIPSLSVPVEIVPDLEERVHAVNQAVLQPLGRRYPIVVSDGRRKAATSGLTFRTLDEVDGPALRAIFDDVSVLLLDAPLDHGLGFVHEYLAFGELRERRFDPQHGPNPWRNWSVGYTVVDRPAGGQQALRTWATVLAENTAWSDVVNTFTTWSDLLTGNTS